MGVTFSRIPKKAPKRTCNNILVKARIVSIYDSDTYRCIFKLKGERFYDTSVRISGIDGPELKPSLKSCNGSESLRRLHKKAGFHCKKIVQNILPPGKIVYLHLNGFDKYGRNLADVYIRKYFFSHILSEIDLGRYLLDLGAVLPYDGKTKTEFTREHLQRILLI